jgi:hypothetical protein
MQLRPSHALAAGKHGSPAQILSTEYFVLIVIIALAEKINKK